MADVYTGLQISTNINALKTKVLNYFWRYMQNKGFYILLTIEKKIQYQQNIDKYA